MFIPINHLAEEMIAVTNASIVRSVLTELNAGLQSADFTQQRLAAGIYGVEPWTFQLPGGTWAKLSISTGSNVATVVLVIGVSTRVACVDGGPDDLVSRRQLFEAFADLNFGLFGQPFVPLFRYDGAMRAVINAPAGSLGGARFKIVAPQPFTPAITASPGAEFDGVRGRDHLTVVEPAA